jgi:CheY-like chemotaxis protein
MLPEAATQTARARILLVEDEVLIRSVLADEMRDSGFSVIEASNADEALSYLAAGEPVDLVFSDIHMPGTLNGLELARKLRQERPLLPIVLTSGNAGPRGAEGIGLFLLKPYRIAVAVALIEKALGIERPGEGK